eukprot:1616363-Rhodomonas_salina.1
MVLRAPYAMSSTEIAMVLRAPYAMSSTEIAMVLRGVLVPVRLEGGMDESVMVLSGGMRRRLKPPLVAAYSSSIQTQHTDAAYSTTGIARAPISLREFYAMSGTDIGYAATSHSRRSAAGHRESERTHTQVLHPA